MVHHLSKFIQELSHLQESLIALTKKDIQFNWTPSHEKQLNTIKQEISSTATLRYFDVDVSHHSTGRCILNWTWSGHSSR